MPKPLSDFQVSEKAIAAAELAVNDVPVDADGFWWADEIVPAALNAAAPLIAREAVRVELQALADEFHRREKAAHEDGIAEREAHGRNDESRCYEGANASARQLVLDRLAALDTTSAQEQG